MGLMRTRVWRGVEHEAILKMLDHAGCYDGLDLANLCGVETALRRAQLLEYAYGQDGRQKGKGGGGKGRRDFLQAGLLDEAAVFQGTHREHGDLMVCPALLDYVAREVERDASVLKQVRKAKEERKSAAAYPSDGGGKRGKGE